MNAELRGTVEETITVEGTSPIVDIQNVNQIKVVNRELIETIPTGRGFANFATLIPGVNMSNSSLNISQDVGGGTGYNFAFAAIHGGRAMDQQVMVNGMSVTSLTGTGRHSHQLVRRHGAGAWTAIGGTLGRDRIWRRLRQHPAARRRQQAQW